MSESEISQTHGGSPPGGTRGSALARRTRRAPPRPGRSPQIGDTRPAPVPAAPAAAPAAAVPPGRAARAARRRPRPRRAGAPSRAGLADGRRTARRAPTAATARGGRQAAAQPPALRAGRARASRSGRYLVCVHVQPDMTQIAMLEGRTLVEHYVSRAADDTNQIDGNVYRGRVQNVLPGMEAAFVDIGIPKNAVLYRGDVRYDRDDIEGGAAVRGPAPDRGRAQGRARPSCARSPRTPSGPRAPG